MRCFPCPVKSRLIADNFIRCENADECRGITSGNHLNSPRNGWKGIFCQWLNQKILSKLGINDIKVATNGQLLLPGSNGKDMVGVKHTVQTLDCRLQERLLTVKSQKLFR